MAPDFSCSAPRRQRKRTTHTRTGCRTCKIRRVKCDEQQPSCGKCTVSGRVCDGYGIWGQPSIAQKAIAQQQTFFPTYPPQSFPGLAQQEKRYLDQFRSLVVDKLAQPFGSYFWSSIVTQLSMTEPAVVHASIALASAYESSLPSKDRTALAGSFTLRQYNQAILALTSDISFEDRASLRTAVVSCVLFICLEILRGDLKAMQAHFSSGVKLLCQLQHGQHRNPMMDRILVKHNAEVLDDHLVDVFTKLNLHFLMLGHGSQLKQTFVPSFMYDRRIQVPRHFSSSREARQTLNIILCAVIHLVKEAEELTLTTNLHPPPPTGSALEEQRALQQALSEWTAAYDLSVGELCATELAHESLRLTMLRIYADMFTQFLTTSFSIKETAYDAHTAVFESIIKRYAEVLSVQEAAVHDSRVNSNRFFTIDMGFFPPLYCTALKCRNPKIRRDALSLLRRFRHMEGPWTGAMLARVAEYVVRLEEEHFEGAQHSTSAVVLPEFCRIHCVECKLPNQHGQGSNIGSLTLRRFRHELGKAGNWSVTKCDIDLTL